LEEEKSATLAKERFEYLLFMLHLKKTIESETAAYSLILINLGKNAHKGLGYIVNWIIR